jgi:hypothetical protein
MRAIGGRALSNSDNSFGNSVLYEPCSIVNAQFSHNMLSVGLNCTNANGQALCNLLSSVSLGKQSQYFIFAGG